MDEMDIDMEIDLQIDPEAEAHADSVNNPTQPNPFMNTAPEVDVVPTPNHMAPMDTIRDGAEPIAEKIHIRGLDNFSTDDVKAIASEHFPQDFLRVEWIDDTSANLVYASPEAGTQALYAITESSGTEGLTLAPLQLRPAKRLSTHALTNLYIRQATSDDVKQKNAHQASRYYLFHGDPRERKQQNNRGDRRGPRQRRGSNEEDGEYSRRRFDDRELKRRRDAQGFDANMYDEGETTGVSDADDLFSSAQRKKIRIGGNAPRRRDGEDLFSSKTGQGMSGSRFRDRSASPSRNGDGRLGFGSDLDAVFRKRARARSQTPPQYRRDRGQAAPQSGGNRELFPPADLMETMSTRPSTLLTSNPSVNLNNSTPKELFPVKIAISPKKELFPSSVGGNTGAAAGGGGGGRSHHRRSGAVDASPRNSTFDLLSNGNGLNGFAESPTALNSSIKKSTLSLADRISRGGGDLSVKGSAAASTTSTFGNGAARRRGGNDDDLNVRGAGGFSVLGAAVTTNSGSTASLPTARELFPMKAGSNAGKELFGGKIQGRERVRRRAEEFY